MFASPQRPPVPPSHLHDPALLALGLRSEITTWLEPHVAAGRLAGRVTRSDRGVVTVACPHAVRARSHRVESVAVGDWVAVEPSTPDDLALVVAVAPRRAALSRRAAGEKTVEQVLAANVDRVLIAFALDRSFNGRRVERALALAWESGADPVILLTKADVVDDVEPYRAEVEAVAFGVPVLAVSTVTGEGVEDVRGYAGAGLTLVLLGASGAGKSSLANRLAGEQVLRVQDVREDGKGRHTTTHRELVPLPGGAVLIDTPGLRGLGLWDAGDGAGLERTFADVEALATSCRFADCQHEGEPGCEVTAAIRTGRLDRQRLEDLRHLERERAWLARRTDARARADERRRYRTMERARRADPRSR